MIGEDLLSLPKHWLNCPKEAVDLLCGKFWTFKTPLDSKFDRFIPQEKLRFTTDTVFSSANSRNLNLKLWIDLTRTDKYFNKSEIEGKGCKYVKLECQGFDRAPTVEQTNLFIQTCKDFIRENPDCVIGVHCTHGFNRTGFVLVSFLIEEQKLSIESAIAEFANVRPPGIYKDYLKELFVRYGECIPKVSLTPPCPMWCIDTDLNNESLVNKSRPKNAIENDQSRVNRFK